MSGGALNQCKSFVDKPGALPHKVPELMLASLQSEFQLRVAVCAWCKPKNRGADLGNSPGSISHGICPGHLKKLRLELQLKKNGGLPTPTPAPHSRRRRAPFNHPQLNYQS